MEQEKSKEFLLSLAVSLRVIGLQVTQEDCVMILNVIDAVKQNTDIRMMELYSIIEKSKEEIDSMNNKQHVSLV